MTFTTLQKHWHWLTLPVCVSHLNEWLRIDITAMNMCDDNLLIKKFSQKYKLRQLLHLM
jgi:hypothetical protein